MEGPTGTIAHLVRGFGDDGMWYEGENYHLFALRGQLLAMGWAKQAAWTSWAIRGSPLDWRARCGRRR